MISGANPCLSGWPDSNRRPPRPKRGALTKLRYSPCPASVAARGPRSGRIADLRLARLTRRRPRSASRILAQCRHPAPGTQAERPRALRSLNGPTGSSPGGHHGRGGSARGPGRRSASISSALSRGLNAPLACSTVCRRRLCLGLWQVRCAFGLLASWEVTTIAGVSRVPAVLTAGTRELVLRQRDRQRRADPHRLAELDVRDMTAGYARTDRDSLMAGFGRI